MASTDMIVSVYRTRMVEVMTQNGSLSLVRFLDTGVQVWADTKRLHGAGRVARS